MTTKEERHPLLKATNESSYEFVGLSLMALAALLFSIQGLLVRYVTGYDGLSVSTVVLIRGITQTVLTIIATAIVPEGRRVFTNTPKLWALLALRGCSGAIAIAAQFLAISILPLSVASSIYYTNPVWVLLFGALALRESVHQRLAFAAFLSILGTILVTDPFNQKLQNLAGAAFALAAAILAALAYTTLRAIATQVQFLASVLSFGVFTLVMGLICGGMGELFKSATACGIAFAAATAAFGAQCAISKGYEYCAAGKGALVRNLELPLAYIFGIAFLGEVPNVVSVSGGLLILIATFIIGYESIRKEDNQDGD